MIESRPSVHRAVPPSWHAGALALFSTLLSALVLVLAVGPVAYAEEDLTSLEFLGEAVIPVGSLVGDAPVGGLSGLTYSGQGDRYFSVSDDPSQRGPARIYTLEISLDGGHLGPDGARVVASMPLLDLEGRPFALKTLDPEGIARRSDGSFYVSSEGQVDLGVDPFIAHFGPDGRLLETLEVPEYYLPDGSGQRGVRHNQAFESLSLSPDGGTLWSATEDALVQDGPAADLERSSPSRLLRFDTASGKLVAEYLYRVDPVAAPAVEEGGLEINGVVELIALGDEHLLALERSYSAGAGHSIRLYSVSLEGADRVSGPTLSPATTQEASKALVLDFGKLGIRLDNLEGMTFGPTLDDGRRLLLVVSDDNFNDQQVTQVLAFAAGFGEVAIPAIQGAGHRSTRQGRWVREVRGVVTAVEPARRAPIDAGIAAPEAGPAFWFQSLRGDGDEATSDGMRVTGATTPVTMGDVVRVAGRVVEDVAALGELPVTTLADATVRVEASENPLPLPVILGEGGRKPPVQILDGDGFTAYRPEIDAIDFYESLEGMRVEVREPVVVGPTTYYGGLAVIGDDGRGAGPRTTRGGLVLRPDDFNPERILVETGLVKPAPQLKVGDRLTAPVTGVMAYRFGDWWVWATEPLAPAEPAEWSRDLTSLRGDADHLTVATYNVLNLDGRDPQEHFDRLARTIVSDLGTPDLLGLQEIQDDDGALDDGVVSASVTLGRLVEAITAAGGPRYELRQIDPEDNADGGQPGGNIRVAYLFNPMRLRFVDRGHAGALDVTEVLRGADGPHLSLSPGRLAPRSPAFAAEPGGDGEGGRKPLAAELIFAGRRFFVINNHLKSKRGDDRLYGERQPPVQGTEVQRVAQAKLLAGFVEELLAVDPEAAVIVLGDLNEHEFRSPLAVLEGAGLDNLVERVPLEDRYTYNYIGNSQILDNVLVSSSLARRDPEIDVVHANADYPASEAASDHDPIVVRLSLDDR